MCPFMYFFLLNLHAFCSQIKYVYYDKCICIIFVFVFIFLRLFSVFLKKYFCVFIFIVIVYCCCLSYAGKTNQLINLSSNIMQLLEQLALFVISHSCVS